jgi:hypothetical protein
MSELITKKIKEHIAALNSNEAFVSSDFLDIANIETIQRLLSRLADEKKIQRILRGVYYQPRFSELLQEYEAPSPHQVAFAIARKHNWNIAPSGVTALNMLGLSTQVSANWSYITDGIRSKKSFSFGNITIEYKPRSNREITGMSYKTALIIQGIKALGKGKVDDSAVKKLEGSLTWDEKKALLLEAKPAAAWVYQTIRTICGGNGNV